MIPFLLSAAVLALTVLSCVSDIRTMRIPNLYSALIIAFFIPAFFLEPAAFGRWWEPLGAFALMFAVTFGMYCAGMVGSGDTKLGSVLALWLGLKGLILYLFWMALMGGVLGVLSILMRRKKPFRNPPEGSWMAVAQSGKSAVPYGVAISFGFWVSFFHTGIFHHGIDELSKIIH